MSAFSFYELHPDLSPLRVVDVGALDLPGMEPRYAKLVRAGHAAVTGFEPNLRACAELTQKYGAPHRFLPSFVGDGSPAKFYATNYPATGSLFPPNQPLLQTFYDLAEFTTAVMAQDVDTVRLDDVPDISDADFLTVDVQGSELNVFKGATRILEDVVLIQTEVEFVELYAGQALFADIDRFLRSQGFWFHMFLDVASRTIRPHPRAGTDAFGFDSGLNQQLWADAVYTRSPLDLEVLPDMKLLKLAALLHDLYGSFDFAHACLDAIDGRRGSKLAEDYLARLSAS